MANYVGEYLAKYKDTEVRVVDIARFDDGDVLVFDLSDGTHWLTDINDTCQVAESLCEVDDIVYDEYRGYIAVEKKPIKYVED